MIVLMEGGALGPVHSNSTLVSDARAAALPAFFSAPKRGR